MPSHKVKCVAGADVGDIDPVTRAEGYDGADEGDNDAVNGIYGDLKKLEK